MPNDVEALRHADLFSDMPEDDLTAIAQRVQHRRYQAGEVVFKEGQPGNALFILVTGEVKIWRASTTGREITLALLEPGATFGELALMDGARRSAAATAVTACEMLVLYRDDFQQLVESDPSLTKAVLTSMAAMVRNTNRKLEIAAVQDVPTRMGMALSMLADRYGREVEDGIHIDRIVTPEDLASLTLLHVEEVRRYLRNYQYENIIRADHDHLILTRPDVIKGWSAGT